MAVNGRNKGASAERELALLLMGWGLEIGARLDIKRNLEQVRGGGYDLDGVPGLAIECKRVEALDLKNWWAQACRQATGGRIPFLGYRTNRQPWRFMVRAPVTFLSPTGAAAGAAWLDVGMDSTQGKIWFQGYLYHMGVAKLGDQE